MQAVIDGNSAAAGQGAAQVEGLGTEPESNSFLERADSPDIETGFDAEVSNIEKPAYQDKTVLQAVSRWAPKGDDNDPATYAKTISSWTGLDVNTPLNQLTRPQLINVANAIQRFERSGHAAATVVLPSSSGKQGLIMRALPLLLIPACFILTMVAHAQPCPSPLSTDNQKSVSLVGTLHPETHWGPPGFGESPKTDTKFIAWVLKLDQPIQFHLGNEGSSPKDLSTRKIQLQSLSDMPVASIKKMVGKKVVASGPLYAATTGGDVTPVIVSSETVRLVGDDALPECSVAE